MLSPDVVSLYLRQRRLLRAGVWAVFGAIAALGQAPFGWALASLLGFAAAFGAFAKLRELENPKLMGWAFGFGYFLLTLQWLVSPFLVEPEQYGWMAPFAVMLMSGGLALFWGAAFWGSARLGYSSALIFTLPLAELARAYVLTGFAWGMPAYGLVDSALGQGASLVGSHGLNVLFLLIAWAMAKLILVEGGWRRFYAVLAVIGVVAVLWPAPEARVPQSNAPMIRVVQPNATQRDKWNPDVMPAIFERGLDLTRHPSDVPIALTIWPETSLPEILNYGDSYLAEVTAAAGLSPVVIGANRFEGSLLFNSAVLLGSDGEAKAIYDKNHLVPFGEYLPFGEFFARFGYYGMAASQGNGFSSGEAGELMDLGPVGRAFPLICYEVVFPQDVRASRSRPDMLMQITNDAWFGNFSGPYQHLVQAQMRSIETGLPMVRAANTGVSAMIDARGRIVAQLPLNEAGYMDVQRQDPLAETLYAWVGDAPILAFLIAVLLGYAVRRPSEFA